MNISKVIWFVLALALIIGVSCAKKKSSTPAATSTWTYLNESRRIGASMTEVSGVGLVLAASSNSWISQYLGSSEISSPAYQNAVMLISTNHGLTWNQSQSAYVFGDYANFENHNIGNSTYPFQGLGFIDSTYEQKYKFWWLKTQNVSTDFVYTSIKEYSRLTGYFCYDSGKFSDGRIIVFCKEPATAYLMTSTDNGRSWSTYSTLSGDCSSMPTHLLISSTDKAILWGSQAICFSSDHGVNWTQVMDASISGTAANLFAMTSSGDTFYSYGGYSTFGLFLKSTDGGSSWSVNGSGDQLYLLGHISGMTLDASGNLYATVSTSQIGTVVHKGGYDTTSVLKWLTYSSTNDGLNWGLVDTVTGDMYGAMPSFMYTDTSDNIYAVGQVFTDGTDSVLGSTNMVIRRSSDYGQNWTTVETYSASPSTESSPTPET